MDIECKLKREGGTIVELGKDKYHFKPLADGAHVAAVTIEAHQDIFLGIPEAYRMYRGKPVAAPVEAPVAPVAQDEQEPEHDPRDTNGDGEVDASEERAALAAEYKARFGKAPASRLSITKIREALAAQ